MMTDLNASMMTDNMNIMTVLYSTSRKIEPVEIMAVRWCTCEVNSYKIMFLIAPYSAPKLFEFQERNITSAMASVDV